MSEKQKRVGPPTLPIGWVWTRLGEIISVHSGKGLTIRNMTEDGKYPVYGGNGITGYYDNYLFEESKIIIGRVGAKCGVVHITAPNSWVTDNALIVDSWEIDSKFLFYALRTLNLNRVSVSTAQPVVSSAKIYELPFRLPPFQEQGRIVAKIEELFSFLKEGIELLHKVKAQVKNYRQAVLKYAFEGKLSGTKPKFRYDQELGVEVPTDWNMKRAEELFYLKGRIGWRGLKKAHFVSEGPYLITGVDFKNGSVDWKSCYHIPIAKYLESPEIFVQKDDVLLTKDGTIGKVACVDEIPNGKASLNAHLLLIRNLEKTVIMPKFTYYMLQAPNFLNFVEHRKIGTTRPSLTQRAFEDFPFYYPKFEEQREIVVGIERFLSIADDLNRNIGQNLMRAKVLQQSIQQSAFEGRLVCQNPADEPAENLLNQIRSEREGKKKYKIDNQLELSEYVK
jgi:type I restriction enzyme S subunit